MIKINKFVLLLFLFSFCLFSGDYNRIGNFEIPDHGHDDSSGLFFNATFLLPNEDSPALFKPLDELVAQDNAYMVVGSFRGLISFAQGRFNRLIMTDRDYGMVLFNRANLDLLKLLAQTYPGDSTTQRILYIYFVKGLWPSTHKLAEWVEMESIYSESFEKRRYLIRYLVNEMDSSEDQDDYTQMPDVFSAFRQQDGIWQRLTNQMIEQFKCDGDDGLFSYFSLKSLEPNFWENNKEWNHIQEALAENRIHVVQANLLNVDSCAPIIEALNSIDAKVSVVDISNIPDYLRKQEELYSLKRVIQSLTKTTTAKMWMTRALNKRWNRGSISKPSGGFELLGRTADWAYFELDANNWNLIK